MIALALATPASACDHVEIDVEGAEVDVLDCSGDHYDGGSDDDDSDDPPTASIHTSDADEQHLVAQYGMQFLPDLPGHQLGLRFVGDKDAYLSGELRYTPASDLLWTARFGAGLDLLGRSDWDLSLGLFIGSAGEWDRQDERALLYSAPIAGTEVAFGYEGDRLFGKYRWLGGIGGGPVDELLTENEFTLGYKLTNTLHAYGQYLILSPGELDNEAGVGLGARLVF
jgi:hypothetical protein